MLWLTRWKKKSCSTRQHVSSRWRWRGRRRRVAGSAQYITGSNHPIYVGGEALHLEIGWRFEVFLLSDNAGGDGQDD
jgi:hypothetical protein